MRKQSPLFLIMFLISAFVSGAQEIDHPTIANLQVSYRIDPVSEFVPDSVLKARTNIAIQLDDSVSVASIHLKIRNQISDALLYEVTYSVSPEPVINDSGITLYKKEGNTLYIIAPDVVTLTLYKYEVTTEDASASVSPVYSSIQ